MLAAFGEVAAGLTYRDPEIPIISNVTGQLANPSAGDLTSPEYWVRHIRQTVRFFDGVRAAAQAGVSSFLECGPDAALSQLTARCLAGGADSGSRAIVLPSLSARADELSCLRVRPGRPARPRRRNRLEWDLSGDGRATDRTPHLCLPTRALLVAPSRAGTPRVTIQHGTAHICRVGIFLSATIATCSSCRSVHHFSPNLLIM